ncbi:hypothetical protein BH23PLA1_BH23PLA1_01010 [soil metagenome]
MHWRLLNLARARSASGLRLGLSLSLTLLLGAASTAQESPEPLPDARLASESVDLLKARDAGQVEVLARGQGNDRVSLAIRNTSPRRLKVVVPPGLVASAGVGQGFQSMGLGLPSNRPGAFGQFQPIASGDSIGFRSIAVSAASDADAFTIAPGQAVDLVIPAVCLNYGLPDPTPRDRFELLDVASYTADPRAQLALRSLATLGTSQAVAQAAVWNVFNGMRFQQMTSSAAARKFNRLELALAARFIEALDSGTHPGAIVEPAYLTEGRVFVQVQADEESGLESEALQLAEMLDGLHLLGLPVRVVSGIDKPVASGPALYLVVTLDSSTDTKTIGRVAVHGSGRDGAWKLGGTNKLSADAPISAIDGALLAQAIDRSVASAFVRVLPTGRDSAGNVLRIENGLPFTLASVVVRDNSNAPVTFDRIGVGPLQKAEVRIQAPDASIDRVELNGL